jgi:hypothetical protein
MYVTLEEGVKDQLLGDLHIAEQNTLVVYTVLGVNWEKKQNSAVAVASPRVHVHALQGFSEYNSFALHK